MSTGFRDYNCASSSVAETFKATEVRHVDDSFGVLWNALPTETVRKFSKPSHILVRQLINVRQCFVCHSSWVEILHAQLSSTKTVLLNR